MKEFPRWASAYMRLFCDSDIQEELEGDILSNYNWRIDMGKSIAARLHFVRDVLATTRFLVNKNFSAIIFQQFITALIIYWRSIVKNKAAFTLNLSGLYIGILCFLSILSFYEFEHSYDNFYSNANEIYRIEKIEYGDTEKRRATTPYLLQNFANEQVTGISTITGAVNMRYDRITVQYPEGTPHGGVTAMLVKPNFFELFNFEFVEGNAFEALKGNEHVVITEKMREHVFKEEVALGKEIKVNEEFYTITGVIHLPENSHFDFDFLLNTDRLFDQERWDRQRLASDWGYADFIFHYAVIEKGKEEDVLQFLNSTYTKNKNEARPNVDFQLHPISSIHLDESTDWELADNGNGYMVKLVMLLAVIVLVIVAVNYAFINIARTSNRIKELGVRNILGSSNGSLLLIVFIENSISISLATLLSILTIIWLPSPLPVSLPINIVPAVLISTKSLLIIVELVFSLSLISTMAPMFIIRSIKPMVALKGRITTKYNNLTLLKSLAIVQTMISVGLIISMLFFHQQLEFLFAKDPGFEVENVGYMERYQRGEDLPSYDAFKAELLQIPGIKNVTASAQIPLRWPAGNNYELVLKGQEGGVQCSRAWIDYDYFKTLDLTIIEGRAYSKEVLSDTTAIVIGASAAKQLGLESPIGEVVNIFFRGGDVVEERTIIGVVEDFNYRSFHSEILPHYYMLAPNGPVISINFDDINDLQVHQKIKDLWPKYSPAEAFNFTYMENHFRKQYEADLAQRNAVYILALVVLILACLGIFGISSFIAQKEIKSISIRKVLGARMLALYLMQAKQYFLITSVSFLLCITPVYFAVQTWLDGYAYRIDVMPTNFILGFAAVMLIIIAVVTINLLKVASLNPVNTLKDE